ncbi:uncharacterized protein EpC_11070 [Erwinia pyrifoliae Ep1/96]|nr:uncharacterized protein EpC_11070 [Erwinia pyrifoliae Ep1/96]
MRMRQIRMGGWIRWGWRSVILNSIPGKKPLELRKEMQEYPHRINLVIFSISETKEYNNIIA